MAAPKTFLLKLKSTIDKLGFDIASDLEMTEFLDIDDREDYSEKVIEGKKDAVLWRIISYDPINHDSLKSLLFVVGISIHSDTNNTKALQSAGVIAEVFKKGCTYPVLDYAVDSGAPIVKVGTMSIFRNSVDEGVQTGISGFRWVTIRAIVSELD